MLLRDVFVDRVEAEEADLTVFLGVSIDVEVALPSHLCWRRREVVCARHPHEQLLWGLGDLEE